MLSWLGARHIVMLTAGLCGIGLALVLSASVADVEASDWTSYLRGHLLGMLLGLGVAAGLAHVPLRWLRILAYPAWGVSLVLLVCTLLPGIALKRGGSWRWLQIGGWEVQPLELAKLAMLLATAHLLATYADRMRDIRVGLLAPAVLSGVPAMLLLMQPDFGGAAMMCVSAGLLAFVAGARASHLALGAAIVGIFASSTLLAADYRSERIAAWWDRMGAEQFPDPGDDDYQARLSLVAFSAGGVFGQGLGAGEQRHKLPEAHTDYIFSIAGEELGLIGVVGILLAFLGLAWCSISVAARAGTTFEMLLATGAGLLLWPQAALNAAVAMDLLPTKGTTLPLLSYGRASLVASLAAIGLLLNVARSPGFNQQERWP